MPSIINNLRRDTKKTIVLLGSLLFLCDQYILNSVISKENNNIENQNSQIKWEKINTGEIQIRKPIKWQPTDDIQRNKIRNISEYDNGKKSNVKFRSVSRNIMLNDTLYPEFSFWIPSSFKQHKEYKLTITTQLLGNPTDKSTKDNCSWNEYWQTCADSQYIIEYTPIINNYLSLGLNYSQQESFIGDKSDGGWKNAGQAIGFQIKANLNESQAISIIGNNLYNPYGKGGPNGRAPKGDESIQADLGRSYLFLYSKAWDLGKVFNNKTNSILTLNSGIGNGRYKSGKEIEKNWINLGKYNPIYSLGYAYNQRLSFFIEDAGQYAGLGFSIKPLQSFPLIGTFMLRDFKGSKSGIVNCKDGDKENCRMTVDARLSFHF